MTIASRTTPLGLAGLAVLLVSGCGTVRYAEVRADGIYYLRYSYLVRYEHPIPRTVMRGWALDNFHEDGSGARVLRTGKRYVGTIRIDRDGDGKHEMEKAYTFDLKLKHRSSNAVLWIQNQELSEETALKTRESLLENYVQSLTRRGFYAETNAHSVLQVKKKQYVAVVKEQKETRLGSYRAISARIQVYNIEQRKIDPNHQGDMIQVTLLKVPFRYDLGEDSQVPETRSGYTVMVVGYCSATPAFSKQLPAYRKLLRQIRIPFRP